MSDQPAQKPTSGSDASRRQAELLAAKAKLEARAARLEAEALALEAELAESNRSDSAAAAVEEGKANDVAQKESTKKSTAKDEPRQNADSADDGPTRPQRSEPAPNRPKAKPSGAASAESAPGNGNASGGRSTKNGQSAPAPAPKRPAPQPAPRPTPASEKSESPEPKPADSKPRPKPATRPANRPAAEGAALSAAAAPPAAAPRTAPAADRPPPPQEAPPASGDVAQAPADDEVPPQDATNSATKVLLVLPGWLVSMLFHILVLLIAALTSFSLPEVREEIFQTAQVERDEEEEVLEDFEIQEQEFELTETSFQAAELVDPGMANFGDISAPVTTEAAGVGEIETNTAAIDVGELFGEDGMGMSDVGAGMGGTSFFGVQTTGQRFVYVVDNSNSMNNGKFETAVYELMNSVDQLTEDHLFYVIFYSDMAYPLFYPQSAPRWVRATEENKYKLRSWLATVHRCLQTRGESAMAMALKLDPDVIYLLGDGAFTDNTAERTLEIRQKFPYLPVQIHTMGFRMKDKDRQMFTQIAQAYGGTFNEVDIRPEMVQLAKNLNRPKNREPNGPWGKALGKKK